MKHQRNTEVKAEKRLTASRYLLAAFIAGLLITTQWSRGFSKILNNLGSVYLNRALLSNIGETAVNENFTDAGLKFQQALSRNDGYGYAYYNLGTIYSHFGDWYTAQEAFAKASGALPEDAVSLFQLGMAKASLGDEDGAIVLWQQAGAASYFVNSARLHIKEGDIDSARRDAQRAITIDPSLTRAYYTLGEVYTRQKDYSQALQAYQTSLVITPESAISLYQVGRMYDLLQQTDKAIVYYQRALIQQPHYRPALRSLAIVYANLVQCEQSKAILQPFLSLKSQPTHSADALRIISGCYLKNQNTGSALRYLERLADYDSVTSADFIQLAKAYEALGRGGDAFDVYNHILLIDPDHQEAQEALIRLKRGEE